MRGREIGMIFQEPMTSLNPVLTVGRQLTEPPRDPPRHDAGPVAGPRDRDALAGGHLRRSAAPPPVPAPVQRRHAAAHDDRHGAGLQSGADPGRRADHRARRDDPGPDPRADEGALAAAGRRHADDHAQPGRGRPLRRPGERDVRGQDRGARDRARDLRQPAPSLHARAAALGAAAGRAAPGQAAAHSRPAPRPLAAARGLRLRTRAAPTSWSAAAREVPPLDEISAGARLRLLGRQATCQR